MTAAARPSNDQVLYLRPDEIRVDHSDNISRSGKPHDRAYVATLAERILATGQIMAIEVYKLPEDSESDPWRISAGYGRWEAGELLRVQGRTSECYDGRLRCTVAPFGLTKEDVQNRNLEENIYRKDMSLIDKALAVWHLCSPPEEGGRGEDIRVIGGRIGIEAPEVHKMKKLHALNDQARELVRLNHRDPELGLNEALAYKLSQKSDEEQTRVLDKAKDATGRITPKAVRSVIAPAGGRQGQPEAVTGAALSHVIQRLDRLGKSKSEMTKKGVTPEQVDFARKIVQALLTREAKDYDALPGSLGSMIKAELDKL